MDKREALRRLWDAGGHAYLKFSYAQDIATAFGVTLHGPQSIQANTGEFKGLEVPGAAPFTPIEGFSSADLAEIIANSMVAEPDRDYRRMMGRGSRARAACSAIEEVLKASEDLPKT